MCCLTIVKTETNKMVITHNRDEQWSRQSDGSNVQDLIVKGKKIWMPKDSLSGGTWIGTDGVRVAAILNGFKENHIKKPMYKSSRGNIIPQFFSALSTDNFLSKFDPSGLEPFTLILVDDHQTILELGWDEKTMQVSDKTNNVPLIYSSVTLYNSTICESRKTLFESQFNQPIDHDDLWMFHEKKGNDHGTYINVNYNEEISTVAISQIIVDDISIFHYQSLLNNNVKQSILLLQ